VNAARGDPWAALARPPEGPLERVRRLEDALERERDLRDRTERMLEEETRRLYLAHEQLAAEHERTLAAEQRERERLRRELALARDIQAALLPRAVVVAGLEVAAAMLPCAAMGGDYYDIRPVDDGCWIGIGDVAGHGMSAGLVMLMLHSVAAALTRSPAVAAPSDVLARINEVLHENIRARMGRDEHVTASLLRYHADGRVVFAGGHEELLVLRARTGACERIETAGAWLGIVPDVRRVVRDAELRLAPGDTLVLYTDGLTEAPGPGGERFGVARVCAEIERRAAAPPRELLAGLLAELHGFAGAPADDVTVLVLRRGGPPGP
jgi:serine phosphatase RsbU (regulator of sigma subunit)